MAGVLVDCPNHEGSYDCTPFCELCAGEQELEQAGHVFGELCSGFCPSCSLGRG